MDTATNIEQIVKSYILNELLSGEDPAQLTESTPLIAGGILDSIATLNLVMFLEETFAVEIAAHEVDAQHLGTVREIAELVRSKM
jgi:acyl carrier protein